MKTVISALAISLALTAPVFAESQHSSGESKLSSTSMMTRQEHVQSMNSLMNALKKEKDPSKRQKLLQKHSNEMETGMHMMNQMENSSEDLSIFSKTIPERMDIMEKRMGMMQMMISQIIDHQVQAESVKRTHRHKRR